MQNTITAQAPCRVDLAGGTLDLWPLYLFHPGAVTVNFAVDIQTRCRLAPTADGSFHFKSLDTGREERFAGVRELIAAKSLKHPLAAYLVRFFQPKTGLSIETHSQSPAGAGISGSSALMIASTAALARYAGQKLDREQIRVVAQNVEAQLIRVPTGCQDYYPALYGGVSAIHLREDGIAREAIAVDPEEIESRFVLVYTGKPRQSGINNWEVFKRHIDGDRKVQRNFAGIAAIARDMHAALAAADWDAVAKLLHAEWTHRKTNAPGITTPAIEKLVAAAKKKGARAAKVCGAGGGGCMVLFADPDARSGVEAAVAKAGGQVLPCKVSRQGLRFLR